MGFLLLYGCTNGTNKIHWEKARWELHKNVMSCLEQILEAAPQETEMATYLPSHKQFKLDEQDMLGTDGHVGMNK